LEENRVRLEFDHLMIAEKEQEIEKLQQERKDIRDQLSDRSERVDRN
jgi:hypothetical protein